MQAASLSGLELGPLQADLRVLNVLDTDCSTPAGSEHRPVGIPQDERSFSLTLRASF